MEKFSVFSQVSVVKFRHRGMEDTDILKDIVKRVVREFEEGRRTGDRYWEMLSEFFKAAYNIDSIQFGLSFKNEDERDLMRRRLGKLIKRELAERRKL